MTSEREQFRAKVRSILSKLDPRYLSYQESEFSMIRSPYEYIEYYATENRMINTAIALPLARGLHNGSYRKSVVMKGGTACRMPYVMHCLIVCRILLDIRVPLPTEEEDILLAAALCHDMIEDVEFPKHGEELYTDFGMDKRVYDVVRLLSKRRDFTPEEERAFFQSIMENKYALLIKLSDRSHNVEDLFNMSFDKLHEYTGETRKRVLPMCRYGFEHYPELRASFEILQDKILSLTEATVFLESRYEARCHGLLKQAEDLRKEHDELHRAFLRVWDLTPDLPAPGENVPYEERFAVLRKDITENVTGPEKRDQPRFLKEYAEERGFENLKTVLEFLCHEAEKAGIDLREDEQIRSNLSVPRLLVDLHIPLPEEEEDLMLTASVCHAMENTAFADDISGLFASGRLDPGVEKTLALLAESASAGQEAPDRLQESRPAMLIALADRGNLMKQLYDCSSQRARRYIWETRTIYIPLGICSKEHDYTTAIAVTTLMERLRSLTVVAEILLEKYESAEKELTDEVLLLKEENSRLNAALTVDRLSRRNSGDTL